MLALAQQAPGAFLEQSKSALLLRRGPPKLIPHGCLVLAVYSFKQHLLDITAQRIRDWSAAQGSNMLMSQCHS